jgi:predicted permease
VLLFAIGATIVSALAVSLMPVLRARRVAPGVVLKESSRSATVGRERQRARSALVIAQVALALVLVAGSTLMARSFSELRDVRPGFDARRVLTVRLALPEATYPDAAATLGFYDRVLERVGALPGVSSVAVTEWVPLSDDHNDSVITFEDRPLAPDEVPPDHLVSIVGPTYFGTLGIPVVSGRTFERPDATRPSSEAIVSRAFAERYWKDQSPIGKRIRSNISGPWSTIVGVVGDVHMESLERPADELVYLPLVTSYQDTAYVPTSAAIALRTTGADPMSLAPALRKIIHDLDPTLPTYEERPMSARVAGATARTRFVMLMLGIASLVALTMGMVGLYGVLAYGVTLRRREIGVRMALGATMADVTRMIARRGIALAALGIVAGLVGALGATRLLHGLLYGVSPTDPTALAVTCILLFVVALVASWLPARRAASLDPMEALRSD